MKRILALIAAVCVLACLCACADGDNTETTPAATTESVATTTAAAESSASVEVKVVDADGNGIQGVMLQICKDTCIPMVTDAQGIAKFNLEPTAEHKLSVLSMPEGYVYDGEPEMYLVEGVNEYTVELDAQ